MDTRVEQVVLETDRHRIVGALTLPAEGYRSRLSDHLNRVDVEFIALANAEVSQLEGGLTEVHSFVAVARRHIRLVFPADPNR